MAKPRSPLALKRGPKKFNNATLIRKLETLRKKRKRRKFLRPSSRMWPGQIKAGVEALQPFLHTGELGWNRVYPIEHEKIVMAVFKACVQARIARAEVLERRARKRAIKQSIEELHA